MKVTREDAQTREVTLTIDMDEADVEPYLQRGYKRVVQRINVPGFRKGKAPRSLVERYVSREALLRETLEDLIDETVDKAVKEQSLQAYALPDVDLERLNPPLIKAKVPLEPVVDLGDYRSLRIPLQVEPVTEERVSEVVERLRRDVAPWEPVERAVQEGDRATVDMRATIGDNSVLNEKNVEYAVVAGSPIPLPGAAEQVIGMGKGETKEFDVTVPEEGSNRDLAGKTAHFTVTVHEVKAKVLPALDDAFARSVGAGEYENLEALQKDVRQRLQDEAERQARAALRDTAMNQVAEGAKVDLAPLILERELDHLLSEQEQALRDRRVPVEEYLKQIGKTAEQLREELRPRALERVRRSLVVGKLAELEGVTVTDADVDRELASMRSSEGGQSLAQAFDSPQGRRSLASIILNRKVLARLEEIVSQNAGLTVVSTGSPASTPANPAQPAEGGSA